MSLLSIWVGIGRYLDGWIHDDSCGDIAVIEFGGEQTLQMHGNSQGFPYNSALFGLVRCARV